MSVALVLTAPVRAMSVTLMYRRPRGSVLVDEVRVIVIDGGLDPTRGVLSLPPR
jgi:hypothetical protein